MLAPCEAARQDECLTSHAAATPRIITRCALHRASHVHVRISHAHIWPLAHILYVCVEPPTHVYSGTILHRCARSVEYVLHALQVYNNGELSMGDDSTLVNNDRVYRDHS